MWQTDIVVGQVVGVLGPVWIENQREQAVTVVAGGDLLVMRPGSHYCAWATPPETTRASRRRISEALAAVVKNRSARR